MLHFTCWWKWLIQNTQEVWRRLGQPVKLSVFKTGQQMDKILDWQTDWHIRWVTVELIKYSESRWVKQYNTHAAWHSIWCFIIIINGGKVSNTYFLTLLPCVPINTCTRLHKFTRFRKLGKKLQKDWFCLSYCRQ